MTCQDTLIPLYTYPLSGGSQPPWTEVIGRLAGQNYNSPLQPGKTRWIIFSNDLTSGTAYNSDWGTTMANAHDVTRSPPGTKVLAYINLSFGSIGEAVVKSNIDTANALYFGGPSNNPLIYFDGIFLDQTPGSQAIYQIWAGTGAIPSSYTTYLTDIMAYAVASSFGTGCTFWMNPGFWPDEALMTLGYDTRFSVENTYAIWSTTDIQLEPAWVFNYNSNRIAVISHDASVSQMATGAILAQQNNMGVSFFTDGTGGDPYGTGLPTYWSTEAQNYNTGCGSGTICTIQNNLTMGTGATPSNAILALWPYNNNPVVLSPGANFNIPTDYWTEWLSDANNIELVAGGTVAFVSSP